MISNKFLFSVMTIISLLALVVNAAFHGRASWYYDGLGNCGTWNTNADHIVALSTQEYNKGSHCGNMIRVHYKGRMLDVKVVDSCPGCLRYNIDLSISSFISLAPLELGLINVTWEYLG
ncbi:hypothetical protein BYT27DRAFT_7164218 [Phlegmacium glaucopus]|nr:hypothetical protein BYT27DRAFT_7164218 [Phlegmacium glaucopus]